MGVESCFLVEVDSGGGRLEAADDELDERNLHER
jgi:hypothetical protein